MNVSSEVRISNISSEVYEQAERPDKDARDFTEKPPKVYWK